MSGDGDVRTASRRKRARKRPRGAPSALGGDALWFKDAIVYQVHVRAFRDADGDGIGDFRGLTQKFDYLEDLGVTAVWLLPFYPSPLRDDGYDIADYTSVHSSYGTLDAAREFVAEAHRRGVRVITELVCNHTSDQHEWFQRARRAKPGSPERDFYVWSDTNTRYSEARIIFKDFETSNWTWDPLAKAYFWHRFYSHQPDLNFDNPRVREAIFGVMDFWLDLGVDGLRLDAVPYLFEREGTNCENLPETHELLRALRAHIDARYGARMLLAEANQWPEDAAAYFGKGDECHMAFHFPLMPRMFMALRMEDRFPVVDILAQTPAIPENAQWALFLRNHDELTLEMVTDEERDYMYQAYAQDSRARINLGIRRRLAPLLGNNRRRMELMNALLFSLPGTPVIYYGDEIGMGDNIYLGDRNGVRTPMQWSPDLNAGFSEANRQRLFLPVIVDPEYHFESLNVQTQQSNRHSYLWWMKRLIALRKRYRAFGRGDLRLLPLDNWRILAFTRTHGDERILVVANLSRFAQCAQLDLSEFRGQVPVEMLGRVRFPPIGEGRYPLALGPHAFYWFSLEKPAHAWTDGAAAGRREPPRVRAPGASWAEWFGANGESGIASAVATYLPTRRWFAGKASVVRGLRFVDAVPLGAGPRAPRLVLADVDFQDAETTTYSLPLAVASGDEARKVLESSPETAVARLGGGVVHEPLDARLGGALLDTIARRRTLAGDRGAIRGTTTPAFEAILPTGETDGLAPSLLGVEQSNTSIVYGGRLILKLVRRVEEGMSPDLELSRFLNERGFPNTPRVAGALEYVEERHEARTLAILQEFMPNEGDAWRKALDDLGQFFERLLARPRAEAPAASGTLLDLAGATPPAILTDLIGMQLESARLLGRRTAEMHSVLASEPDDPRFAPEAYTTLYQRSLYQSMRNTAGQVMRQLRQAIKEAREDTKPLMQRLLDSEDLVLARLKRIVERKIDAVRIRCHGDFHLGQVLLTGRDAIFIDFEGEPSRSLGERRLKRTPLRDVAGMIRSYQYAATTALEKRILRPQDAAPLEPWARAWSAWTAAAYLGAYLEVAEKDTTRPLYVPRTREERAVLLETHLLSKALYELSYELGSRPDWVRVPLEGILDLLHLEIGAKR